MKPRTVLYSILLISVAVFLFFVGSLTVFPSTATIEFPGEGVYTGELKGRTFHGYGTFKAVTGIVYEGQFKDGSFHGQGTMTFANGAKFVGEFKDGHMHGQGKMIYPDGHAHEGVWDADKFQGDLSDHDHEHDHKH